MLKQILSRMVTSTVEREYSAAVSEIVEPMENLDEGFQFLTLTRGDEQRLQSLVFAGGARESSQVKYYLDRGETLVLILDGNNVACRGFIRHSGFVSFEAIRSVRAIGDNEHFIHFCRTAESYSGLGLYRRLLNFAGEYISGMRNDQSVSITCNDTNIASIKGIERAGFSLDHRWRTIGFLGGRLGIKKSLSHHAKGNSEL